MSDDVRNIFSRRLKIAMSENSMSHRDLANAAGLLASGISHFASGRRMPTAANIVRLADALEVSTDWLLGRSTSRSSEVCRTCQRLWADMRIARKKAKENWQWLESRIPPRTREEGEDE